MVSFIIASVLSVVIVAAAFVAAKKMGSAGSNVELEQLKSDATTLEAKVASFLEDKSDKASKAQLDAVVSETQELVNNLESQQRLLKDIETKLDTAQRDVETKEQGQQEAKSSKEEDEIKLQELLAQYGDVSTQSVGLEQELAQSLKNLDQLMGEVNLSDDQRTILTELSNTLTAAGSRLRDLITDFQAVNERLEGLRQQHKDLEEEYTKLVEQQLGA